MKKRTIILVAIISGVMMFMAVGLYAGTGGCPETVEMKNENAFDQHRMAIVNFDHAQHSEEYGIGCGECHHDKNNEPLAELTCEDEVHSCFECHSGTGAGTPKDFMGPKPDAEALESYYTAVHVNCVGCHKKQDGPKSCNECHAK